MKKQKIQKNALLALFMIIIIIISSSAAAASASDGDIYDEFSISDVIPQEAKEYLCPIGSQDELSEKLLSSLDVPFFIDFSSDSLLAAFRQMMGSFCSLMGITLLACALMSVSAAFGGKNDKVFSTAACSIVALAAFKSAYPFISAAADTLSRLSAFFGGIIPVLSAIYCSAGHPTSAAISSNAIALLCSVIGDFCPAALLPIVKLDFSLGLCASFSASDAAIEAGKFVRRVFGFFAAFLMAVMTTVFAFQSDIAAKADSVGLRALRFAAGRGVPVIGGSVSEAASTMLGSLSLIKSVTGGAGIAVVLILLIPPFASLIFARFSLGACASIAGAAGSKSVSGVLSGCARTIDFVAVVCLIFAIASIFELSVIMNTAF